MGGDGGGPGSPLDAEDGDHRGHDGLLSGHGRARLGGDAGKLGGQVGSTVGPGKQTVGTRGKGGAEVGGAVVVADGEQRDAVAGGQVGERSATDERERGAGGERGTEPAGALVRNGGTPSGCGFDRVAERVGGAGSSWAMTTSGRGA